MQEQFLIAGSGGQGIMFAGELLAYAAMKSGLEVTWIPSYGPEMRGGTAYCVVVVSDRMIGSPTVRNPSIGLVFNNLSFLKYEPMIAAGGLLATNASLILQTSKRTDITNLVIPASDLADEIGEMRLANVVMLGAVLTLRPVVTVEMLKRALEEQLPERHRDKLPANFQALERGAGYVYAAQHTSAAPLSHN